MSDKTDVTHQIAVAAAESIVKGCHDAGLTWRDSFVAVETVLSIVIAYVATQNCHIGCRIPFSTEMLDTMTAAAHTRIVEALQLQGKSP